VRESSPFVPMMMAIVFLFAMSGAYRSMVFNALAPGIKVVGRGIVFCRATFIRCTTL
jgi:hypothetical protein